MPEKMSREELLNYLKETANLIKAGYDSHYDFSSWLSRYPDFKLTLNQYSEGFAKLFRRRNKFSEFLVDLEALVQESGQNRLKIEQFLDEHPAVEKYLQDNILKLQPAAREWNKVLTNPETHSYRKKYVEEQQRALEQEAVLKLATKTTAASPAYPLKPEEYKYWKTQPSAPPLNEPQQKITLQDSPPVAAPVTVPTARVDNTSPAVNTSKNEQPVRSSASSLLNEPQQKIAPQASSTKATPAARPTADNSRRPQPQPPKANAAKHLNKDLEERFEQLKQFQSGDEISDLRKVFSSAFRNLEFLQTMRTIERFLEKMYTPRPYPVPPAVEKSAAEVAKIAIVLVGVSVATRVYSYGCVACVAICTTMTVSLSVRVSLQEGNSYGLASSGFFNNKDKVMPQQGGSDMREPSVLPTVRVR